jgi:16S rRNA C967 or C1407 C5-methylase (RsmB/RsmF family)
MDKDWFNRRTIEDIERNAEIQREILTQATNVLKDDGEIVYSTCSLEPEENELNIDWALKELNVEIKEINCYGAIARANIFGKQLHLSIVNCRRIWPGQTQGFFICKLKKREDKSWK